MRTSIFLLKKVFLLLGLLFLELYGVSQNSIETLEDQLESSFGIDKLVVLNQLVEQSLEIGSRKSLKYGKQAVALAENLFHGGNNLKVNQYYHKVDAFNLLGESHYIREHYYDAQINFKFALEDAINIDYQDGIDKAEKYLSELDSIGVKSNIFKEAINDINLGKTFRDESQDFALLTTIKTAEAYEKNGNYDKAIANYKKAINYLKDKGDDEQIAELYRRIADNYNKAGNIPKSLEYYKLAIGEKEKLGDTTNLEASKESLNSIHSQIDILIEPDKTNVDTTKIMVELKTRNDYKKMALESEANEDYETSIEYYKLYIELNNKIIEDEKEQELALLEKSHRIERNLQDIQLLTQEKEIQELEIHKQENEINQQNKSRKNLIFGIILLLSLLGALYLLYSNKRKDLKRLNIAHKDLKFTRDNLIKAEKKIKTLLGQQLSTAVAQELLSESTDEKMQRKLVCVMFLDIRGFTVFAESKKPEDIIRYQNDVFGFMIDAVYKYNGIINQFLGDGFMATFGAPGSAGNDSENAFLTACEIIRIVNDKSKSGEIPPTSIGIGLHTGKVVVGNVGTNLRKQYSVTGNAVIIASRIEQLNKKYGSQLLISNEVLQRLNLNDFEHYALGEVLLKGREKPVSLYKIL